MQEVRDKDGNGIRILTQVDGNGIDQDRDDGTATGAGKNHVDKAVSKGGAGTDLGKELAAMEIGVAEHAHVFLCAAVGEADGKKSQSVIKE